MPDKLQTFDELVDKRFERLLDLCPYDIPEKYHSRIRRELRAIMKAAVIWSYRHRQLVGDEPFKEELDA